MPQTMINTTLAHYTITAKLGQGGMGEVYRANDTKLDREVAIKVLPESFTNNEERLARFQRENRNAGGTCCAATSRTASSGASGKDIAGGLLTNGTAR